MTEIIVLSVLRFGFDIGVDGFMLWLSFGDVGLFFVDASTDSLLFISVLIFALTRLYRNAKKEA